jgi:hypothetical protein
MASLANKLYITDFSVFVLNVCCVRFFKAAAGCSNYGEGSTTPQQAKSATEKSCLSNRCCTQQTAT